MIVSVFASIALGRRNEFAAFLAQFDGWYAKDVYYLNKYMLGIYPSINTFQERAAQGAAADRLRENLLKTRIATRDTYITDAAIQPRQVWRGELQNYFREANQTLDVLVWQCNITYAGSAALSAGERGLMTMPFFSRVEIGAGSFAQAVKQAPKGAVKKFQPLEVSMKMTQVDAPGHTQLSVTHESQLISTMVIANVPSPADRGPLANPTSPWLEAACVDPNQARAKQPGTFYHINSIEIEVLNEEKSFDLIVDGELYGPVQRISIKALRTRSNDQVTFPVSTFFALDM